jgi:predicted aspartyl protease
VCAAFVACAALAVSSNGLGAAARSTVVPFALVADNVVIGVSVNGVRTSAIFDTGGRNVMTPAFARRLGLTGGGNSRAGGIGSAKVAFTTTRVREVRIGNVALRDQTFLVLPLPYELTNGGPRPVEVDLGAELLGQYAARLDFQSARLTLTPSGAFEPEPGAHPVPISFDEGTPKVEATLDGLGGVFLVDSGSSFEVALTSPFVAAHGLAKRYAASANVAAGQGLGGETYAGLARGNVFSIGSATLAGPVLQLSNDRAGTLASKNYAGIIGIDALKRFTVSFDYAQRLMYLEARPASRTPQPYDRTGMTVDKNDARSFSVSGVLPGEPAARAGLRDGDSIVAVDGVLASAVDTQRWWVLAHGPVGNTLDLTVLRGSARSTHTLTLRDVI